MAVNRCAFHLGSFGVLMAPTASASVHKQRHAVYWLINHQNPIIGKPAWQLLTTTTILVIPSFPSSSLDALAVYIIREKLRTMVRQWLVIWRDSSAIIIIKEKLGLNISYCWSMCSLCTWENSMPHKSFSKALIAEFSFSLWLSDHKLRKVFW